MNNNFLLRLIFYIIGIIIAVLSSGTRDRVGNGNGVYLRTEDVTANRVRAYFRRKQALKKCAQFILRKNKAIILRNANVVFAYDTEKKTFVCLNTKNIKQSVSVEWDMQIKSLNEDIYDNSFERLFDSICVSFNENTSYKNLVQILKDNFDNINETVQPSNNQIREQINEAQKAFEQNELLNINEASENALAQMPGINIAMAKKIIRRINSKGDYLSIEQMCQEMKIKEHFRIQLSNYLCAKPVMRYKKTTKNNDDRIIDL